VPRDCAAAGWRRLFLLMFGCKEEEEVVVVVYVNAPAFAG
jgi:hypothetical protein